MNPYENHTDADLVALLIEGNKKAFEMIYQRYAFELYRYARKNIQDTADCEEIVHDIFESLWKRRGELQHVTVLNAYLFRTVKYKIIRYSQHEAVKRKYAEHFRMFETVYDTITEEHPVPENLEAMIDQGLAELPERCQAAARMKLKENLSVDDIARRMNIRKHTVENYMVIAMNHLRDTYQKMYKMG